MEVLRAHKEAAEGAVRKMQVIKARYGGWMTPSDRAELAQYIHESERLAGLVGRQLAEWRAGRQTRAPIDPLAPHAPDKAMRFLDFPHARPHIKRFMDLVGERAPLIGRAARAARVLAFEKYVD